MFFVREIRTKVPSFWQQLYHEPEVAERGLTVKQKGKVYADEERRAKDSDVGFGDVVLLKDSKPKNKLSPTFEDALYKVTSKKGSGVIIETAEGARYRRNSSHVKKYHRGDELNGARDQLESEETDSANDKAMEDETYNSTSRPRRERCPPERFDEHLLYK